MATMRDVAARAGVSSKTVSRVFNDDPHVSPETRAAVEQAMRELNYVPNVLATTFRAGRSAVIGVAVPDIVDPFFAAIARAVEDAGRERKLSTIVTSLGSDPEAERAEIESLLARQLMGLVLAPIGSDHSWLKRWQEHTAVVFVDRAPIGIVADSFTEDDRGGAYEATRHLLDHGHRQIAYMGDRIELSTEVKRLAGYRDALTDAGIEVREELIRSGTAERDDALAAIASLTSLPDPPTAVFSSNARTSMALAAVRGDERLALVGFGDFPLADVLTPSLTVIDQNPARLGSLAAERIFARSVGGPKRLKRTNVLDIALIERESCRIDPIYAS